MLIATNTTNRKEMAHRLAVTIGAECKYLGGASYSYKVGPYMVEYDGAIIGEHEDLLKISAWLLEAGYITEPVPEMEDVPEVQLDDCEADVPEADLDACEADVPEADLDACETDVPEVDLGACEEDVPASDDSDEITLHLEINSFTPTQMLNLIRMLYARQRLIREMIHSDVFEIADDVIATLSSENITSMSILEHSLMDADERGAFKGIKVDTGLINMVLPFDEADPARWTYCAELFKAIVEKARAATRVNTKKLEPEEREMKYFCHSFLLQLGFGGAEHKELRHALLGHLKGYAAFRTSDKMDAHKQKYSTRRRQEENE